MKLSRLKLQISNDDYTVEVEDLPYERVPPEEPNVNLGFCLVAYFETGTSPEVALASLKAWAIKGHMEDIQVLEEGIAKLRGVRL